MVVDFDKSYIPGYFEPVNPDDIIPRDSCGGFGRIVIAGKLPQVEQEEMLSEDRKLFIKAKLETAIKVIKNKVKSEGCSIRGLFERVEMYSQFYYLMGLVERGANITDTRIKQADIICDYIYDRYGGVTLATFHKKNLTKK